MVRLPLKVVVPVCAAGAVVTIGLVSSTLPPAPEPATQYTFPATTVAPPVVPSTVVGQPVAPPTPSPELAPPPASESAPGVGTVTVTRVVDGDTVEVSDGRTVRVIGIDTPETVAPGQPVECWGPEASQFARETLLGEPVVLVPDPTQDQVDSYGRTLAYIEVGGDDYGVMAVAGGHANVYVYDVPPQRHPQLVAAEQQAQAAGLGVWSATCAAPPTTTDAPPPVVPVPPPAGEDDSDCAPGYSGCVPPYPPDLDCGDLNGPIAVTGSDPHSLDGDGDGRACE